ncbi:MULTISPECIES: hypothetical protein [unclassified Agrobacterium]|uniref:hypothetical protein n=1 Tax=unclassified Agrobacterium TaxID=2632611 RepID=UPI00244AF07D|nr:MULTISPECIES: hypothetical protein [unclassified Agrobacterium]MDH0614143.1 hypothetical protein [Agrobacterium sp. GD03872]MDH0695562.1 hypothetical protein [Agrobacterium sp. GD03871]MDH1058464.1 hypothetical protein [Agrobacterium sp. GD03992]MDH2209594.1 hypothetical protein [Agrobacterium sp. GD03643]MDH2218998.1 hypothetical protein [Agrobacterium sp. GD03638]
MELQRKWDLEDRDEAREYSRDVYKNLVIDAEEAGFNPLTALRNGGGANYNAAAAFAPLSRKAPVRQAVGGSVAGDAFDALGDFITDFDPFKDQKREQEYRLVESQIAALNASALSGAPRGSASYATGGLERRVSGQGGVLGKPAKWEAGDVVVTNPFQTRDVDANWSDAATWEQRYGEPGSWVGGVVVGVADTWDFAKSNVKSAWNSPVSYNSPMRKAARWVDDTFGFKSSKAGRLSRSSNGGGGGW